MPVPKVTKSVDGVSRVTVKVGFRLDSDTMARCYIVRQGYKSASPTPSRKEVMQSVRNWVHQYGDPVHNHLLDDQMSDMAEDVGDKAVQDLLLVVRAHVRFHFPGIS